MLNLSFEWHSDKTSHFPQYYLMNLWTIKSKAVKPIFFFFSPSLENMKAIHMLEGFFFKSHPRLTRYRLQHQDKCLQNSKGELPFEKRPYRLCFLGKEKSEKLKSHVMWASLAVAVLRFSGETICLSGSDIMQTVQSDIYFSYENL